MADTNVNALQGSIERKTVRAGGQFSPTAQSIHNARYGICRTLVEGCRVLDIACGEGLGAAQLRSWGAASVHGVDISEDAVEAAQKTFGDMKGVSFQAKDGLEFLRTTKRKFDLIVCIETIEHVLYQDRFLAGLKKVCSPDGTVVISCPNDTFYFGPGRSLNAHHKTVLDVDEFRARTERRLGPGKYFCGTTLSGFATLPADGPIMEKDNVYPEAPAEVALEIDAEVMGSGAPQVVQLDDPASWIYYIGVYGPAEAKPVLAPILASARFQQPQTGPFQRVHKHNKAIQVSILNEDVGRGKRLVQILSNSERFKMHSLVESSPTIHLLPYSYLIVTEPITKEILQEMQASAPAQIRALLHARALIGVNAGSAIPSPIDTILLDSSIKAQSTLNERILLETVEAAERTCPERTRVVRKDLLQHILDQL